MYMYVHVCNVNSLLLRKNCYEMHFITTDIRNCCTCIAIHLYMHVYFACLHVLYMYYDSYTVQCVLCCRLINRSLYPLAMEVCNYLKIPALSGEAKVLKQWALCKVTNTEHCIIVHITYNVYTVSLPHISGEG